MNASKDALLFASADLDESSLCCYNMGELLQNVPVLTAQDVKKLKKKKTPDDFFKDLIQKNEEEDADSDEEMDSIDEESDHY